MILYSAHGLRFRRVLALGTDLGRRVSIRVSHERIMDSGVPRFCWIWPREGSKRSGIVSGSGPTIVEGVHRRACGVVLLVL